MRNHIEDMDEMLRMFLIRAKLRKKPLPIFIRMIKDD